MAIARLAAYPTVAIALFLLNSRWTVGAWFVSAGFFVAENDAIGQPLLAWDQVREGVYRLRVRLWCGLAHGGAALIVWALRMIAPLASMVLVLAPVGAAALPWYAYFEGHPVRIRYGVPLVVCVRGARRRRHWLASARSASRCRNRRRGSVYLAGLTARSNGAGHRRVTARCAEHGGRGGHRFYCARTTMGARS